MGSLRNQPAAEAPLVTTVHSLKVTNKDDNLSHPANKTWQDMPPHGTTATAPTDAAPLSNIPQDPQHLRRPEIQDCAGHPGNTNRQLQPNDTDIDQDHQQYLLLEYARIQYGVLVNKIDGGWRCAGMSVTGHTVPTPGLELRFNALPRAKSGELLGCHQ